MIHTGIKDLKPPPFVFQELSGPCSGVLTASWDTWDISLTTHVKAVYVPCLDGAFYSKMERPHRDITDLPHPGLVDTIASF